MNALVQEAPCSLNAFIETPTMGRVQVTGRGLTPSQAVANLREMVAILQRHERSAYGP